MKRFLCPRAWIRAVVLPDVGTTVKWVRQTVNGYARTRTRDSDGWRSHELFVAISMSGGAIRPDPYRYRLRELAFMAVGSKVTTTVRRTALMRS